MAKVFITLLPFLLLCALLLHNAECGHDYDESRNPKKNRQQDVQIAGDEVFSNNIAGDTVETKEQWRQKIELKMQRRMQEEERKRAKKQKHERRRERDVSSRTFEVRATETPDPPPHDKVAEVARFIVHTAAWATGGYINHHPGKEGFPMATLLSVSDGFANASTGVPYMYITPKDIAVQDFAKDNRCSLLMSLAETDYCNRKDFDPEDPRCAYVILSGKIKQLKNGTEEWNFASQIYFDRHPGMRQVPTGHKFRFAKFKISELAVQDFFGGLKFPSVKEYFDAKLTDQTERNLSWN